jgi:hypothetical protein
MVRMRILAILRPGGGGGGVRCDGRRVMLWSNRKTEQVKQADSDTSTNKRVDMEDGTGEHIRLNIVTTGRISRTGETPAQQRQVKPRSSQSSHGTLLVMDMTMHRTARIRSILRLSTIVIGEHVGVDVHFLLFGHHMVLVMVRLLVLARTALQRVVEFTRPSGSCSVCSFTATLVEIERHHLRDVMCPVGVGGDEAGGMKRSHGGVEREPIIVMGDTRYDVSIPILGR